MYESLLLPWSPQPTPSELLYRASHLVKTKGTIYLLPPPSPVLRSTFNAPPRPTSRMSSGAIALCKHFERGGASSEHGRPHPFWELPRGSNEEKTAIAAEILERMLREARWRNVVWLHQGVAVYEIRNSGGWGMRWTLEVEGKGKGDGDWVDAAAAADGTEKDSVVEEKIAEVLEAEGDWRVGVDDQSKANEANGQRWEIKSTTFRGFLEPIAGLDHELDEDMEKDLEGH